jgi:hypothetical protein
MKLTVLERRCFQSSTWDKWRVCRYACAYFWFTLNEFEIRIVHVLVDICRKTRIAIGSDLVLLLIYSFFPGVATRRSKTTKSPCSRV